MNDTRCPGMAASDVRHRHPAPPNASASTLGCSGQLIPDTKLSFSSATAGGIPSLN